MSPSLNQLERMLAMVPYLRSHQGIPVAELAREFNITTAAAQKELLALMTTGTGALHDELIDLDQWALDEGVVHIRNADFMPRPLKVTAAEGAALVVALGILRQLASGEQIAIIDSAVAKIEQGIGDRVSAAVDVHVIAADENIRAAVSEALTRQRRLRLVYASDHTDTRTERDVDPLALTSTRGHAYLSAWCHLSEGQRTFRLDRMVEAHVLDDPVADTSADAREPTPTFFDLGPDTATAELDIDPEALWIIDDHQMEMLDEQADGAHRVRVHGIDMEWLRRLVMRGGGAIRVVSPADLRDAVTANALSALATYDGGQQSS